MTSFGIGAALDGMDVVTITGDHVVVTRTRGLQHTKGAGLFTRIEVQETADFAFDIGFVAALFKAARKQHFAQQPFFVGVVHTMAVSVGFPAPSFPGSLCRSMAGFTTRWYRHPSEFKGDSGIRNPASAI